MKTSTELTQIADFVAEYATYLLGSGVHTSRVIRNSRRIGKSQGIDIQLSAFQKSIVMTAHDDSTGENITRVVGIPALPISFERNSDLSALSWEAVDEHLPLDEIRARYERLISKPSIDPIFVLLTVGLANASFCRLFGGDWTAMSIVFTSTLVGLAAKQRMQAHKVNHFIIFILSAFIASLCELRLYGTYMPCHQPALPRTGRAAHQRNNRHTRRPRADRFQPPCQCNVAHSVHCRRAVDDIDNGKR